MLSFEELAEFRADLRAFVPRHKAVVEEFREDGKPWFRVHLPDGGPARSSDRQVRHLTSTVTCFESLADFAAGPDGNDEAFASVSDLLTQFANLAFDHPGDWESDSGALIYCRVRAMGGLVRLIRNPSILTPKEAGELLESKATAIRHLMEFAWESHEQDPPIYGLREANAGATARLDPPQDEPDRRMSSVLTDEEQRGVLERLHAQAGEGQSYPANAFLTYWGLTSLEELAATGHLGELWDEHRAPAVAWLDRALAHQIAYQQQGSEHADPQQLAWTLCAYARFVRDDQLLAKTTPEYALLCAGLAALFAQQRDDGSWRQGKPLFHYPNVGNAYCYMFETMGEMLHLASSGRKAASVLREALLPYAENLRRLFKLAVRQEQPEPSVGWSSGHHQHRTAPESWATASVFRFTQMARALVGYWTNAHAQGLLRASTPPEGANTLKVRGNTWDTGGGSTGLTLATTFLNPVLRKEAVQRAREHPDSVGARFDDPDRPVVDDEGSRSAILFGPPGTGKTTLVRAVAGAMGWPFVEITPAHFLDEGIDLVSKRADEIFSQVMELDRCVVLLDEIDELIKTRSEEADPQERFFTTSMLPRLAKLWEAGKVLFFVNTNDIVHVDPAIRRSQRFDTAMLVLPPGHELKAAEYLKVTRRPWPYTRDEVNESLGLDPCPPKAPGNDKEREDWQAKAVLGWFALLRYDQRSRFARAVKTEIDDGAEEPKAIEAALARFAEELVQLDWMLQWNERSKDQNGSDAEATSSVPEDIKTAAGYLLGKVSGSCRPHHGVKPVVLLDPDAAHKLADGPIGETYVSTECGTLAIVPDDDVASWAAGLGCAIESDGHVSVAAVLPVDHPGHIARDTVFTDGVSEVTPDAALDPDGR